MALTERSRHASAAPDLRRIAALAIGDLVSFMLFAAIGRMSHGEAAGPAAALQVAGTAAPFIVGWFSAAPVAGAFGAAALGRPGAMLRRTALGWAVGCPIGLLLRALILQSPIQMTFALITFATNLIFLLAWRGLFSRIEARRHHSL